MADGTKNIYIDASFLAPSDTTTDTDAELVFAEADVIGAYNMPVVFTTTASVSTTLPTTVVYYHVTTVISGSSGISLEYFSTSITQSGTEVCLVDYSINQTIAGSSDVYLDCFVVGSGIGGPSVTSAYRDTYVSFTAGQAAGSRDKNIPVSFWRWPEVSGTKDLIVNYSYFVPINFTHDINTIINFGSSGTMTTTAQNAYIDLTFAGWVNFPLDSDVFCTLESLEKNIITDLTTISGAVVKYTADIFSSTVTSGVLNSDLFCCLVDFSYINSDLTVISGAVNRINSDLWSCARTINSVGCDIDLLSLKISNFVPSADEYIHADDRISVDITDDIYNVLTSASGITCSGTCCLKIDGTAVPVTFSGITDGYRMYYDPLDDFESLMGSTEFLVHAENSNGDILERSYYLTFGYFVDYDNRPRFGTDYDYGSRVIVRMSAEDLATCSTYSADAYWFDSEERKNVELGASIVGIPPEIVSDADNLGAEIYPESLAFFYGETFKVIVNCKDFVGNEMESYEFEFKIEDAPD